MNNKMFNSKRLISRTKAGLLSSLMIFNAGNMCVNSKVLENKNFKTQDRNYIINKHDKKVAKIAVPVTVATLLLGFCAWYFSGSVSTEENREGPQGTDPLIDPKTTDPVAAESYTEEPIDELIVEEEEDDQKYREYKQALYDWKLDRAEYLNAATSFDEDSKPMLYVLATCLDLFFCWNAHYGGNDDVWENYKKIDFEFAKNAFAGAVININEDYADQVLKFISNLMVNCDDENFNDAIDDFFIFMSLRRKYYKISDFMSKKINYYEDERISYNVLFELILPSQLDIEQQKQILLYISNVLNKKYWEFTGMITFDQLFNASVNALYDLGFCETLLDYKNEESCKKVFNELKSKYKNNEILDYLEFIYKIGIMEISASSKGNNNEQENNRRFWRELPKFSEELIKNELRKMSIDQNEIDNELIKIVSENVLSKDSPKSKIEAGFKGVK